MGFNPISFISSAFHTGERLADKALHTGENLAEDTGKGFDSVMKDVGKAVTHMSPSQIGHSALDLVGMVPVVGTAANLGNAAWYAAQGDWKDAGWSAAAAIPIEGDFVDAAKLGKDGVEIVEDGAKAERAINDGQQAARTAEDGEKALKADQAAGDGTRAEKNAVHGPYSDLKDPPSVGPEKDFTKAQKANILEANRARNGGELRSDQSGIELVPPSKSVKGVRPADNEAQVDHIYPRSKGGSNSYDNAQVLSRKENIEKSDK
jgi:hypothetical protein